MAHDFRIVFDAQMINIEKFNRGDMRQPKFGLVRARDCRGLTIRLPDDVLARIEQVTGQRPGKWLVAIALTMAEGLTNEQNTQAKA